MTVRVNAFARVISNHQNSLKVASNFRSNFCGSKKIFDKIFRCKGKGVKVKTSRIFFRFSELFFWSRNHIKKSEKFDQNCDYLLEKQNFRKHFFSFKFTKKWQEIKNRKILT